MVPITRGKLLVVGELRFMRAVRERKNFSLRLSLFLGYHVLILIIILSNISFDFSLVKSFALFHNLQSTFMVHMASAFLAFGNTYVWAVIIVKKMDL